MALMSGHSNRRQFFRTAAALAVPTFVSASALGRDGRPAPSERLTVGVVGVGSRGFNLLEWFGAEDDAQIVAVCDVDTLHYRDNPWGKGRAFGVEPAVKAVETRYSRRTTGKYRGCAAHRDYRELCARDDLDAIVVATPDHWHALTAIEAMRQGKDVYCEKPVTHFFGEGRLVYREAQRRKTVFQAGSQQRSDALFQRAVELVRNGVIGKVRHVEIGLPEGYPEPQGDTTVQEPPEHLDYEFWCGPAPKLPYMRARHHRWWRGHLAYGGGTLMDWIGHHNDIAHWALEMDRSGPTKVEAVGWEYPETDVYNTPRDYEIRCEYPGGATSSISNRYPNGLKLIGEDGWIFVTRGKMDASDPRWTQADFTPGPLKIAEPTRHARDFLDAVRCRGACLTSAEIAHRSITPGHLGYLSQAVGRPVRWDPQREQIVGDAEAERRLKEFSYRSPWADELSPAHNG